jgi:hypothetical protein
MNEHYTIEITGAQLDLIHRALKALVNGPDHQTLPDEIDLMIDMSDRSNPDPKLRPVPTIEGPSRCQVVNDWASEY